VGSLNVGLISTVSPELGRARGGGDMAHAVRLLERARRVLQGLGAEVVDPGQPTCERPQAARHGRLLRAKGAQVPVVYMGHWTHAHTAIAAVLAADVPVVVWSELRPGGTNLTGVGIFRGALDEIGHPNTLIMGGFDDTVALAALGAYCRAASARASLRGQVCGLMGQRSMGMMAAIANCGSQSTQLAPRRQDVHWVPNEMIQFTWRIHGMSPQYIGKPGRATLARLSRVKGEYVMLVTGGVAFEYPHEELERMFAPFCPRTFIKLDCDVSSLLENMRSNHVSMIYGDFGRDLVEFCRPSGVHPIVLEPAAVGRGAAENRRR
jgi:L-fucose isomerase-like protein